MASAEVGDDVWGEDPTVNRLQERVAQRLGFEAALFVPSGTMGNQLALAAQSRPGDQLVCHADSHVQRYEGGAPAALSGLQVATVTTGDGNLPWERIEPLLGDPDDPHSAPPALVALENTHNRCGGRVLDEEITERTLREAHRRKLRVHLDGARLWNAAVARGVEPAAVARGFDSVSVCFSKGLGAPAGSILASSAEVILRARRLRKRWGGGMRQVGILAAACEFALDHNFERLDRDHDHARSLAEGIEHPELRLAAAPQTNIVLFEVEGDRDSSAIAARFEEAGLRVSTFGPRRIRMVTHLGIDETDCDRALEIVRRVGREGPTPGRGR